MQYRACTSELNTGGRFAVRARQCDSIRGRTKPHLLAQPKPGATGPEFSTDCRHWLKNPLVHAYRKPRLANARAKGKRLPATVPELTDAQALELQVIENNQRVDVHPLDEAQGYAALIELQPDIRPVLPRLQPEAIVDEGLKPRTHRSSVQD